ncbi:MAG: VPLPA-CTERM sorting domain-containing protein [Nitrospira sp.]|nr:VPLPA-CTERM sorting domain-containing protein [Nitrospira sp.]
MGGNTRIAIVGTVSALALVLTTSVASAHVGYGVSLYDQATDTWGPLGTTGFNPTVRSNAGWLSGMSNNGVNRTATIDTLADSHNNRFRFFTLTSPSTVSITVVGTPNTVNGASILNPGFSLFSGQVPPSAHDGVGHTGNLTPGQIATLQSPAMVGDTPGVPDFGGPNGDGGYLRTQPAFATWSPFFRAMDEILAEGGGSVDAGGPNWGVYRSDGDVTMGNNSGQVSTMTFTGIAVGDGHDGDVLDNVVSWTGTLGPGTYSLVIGGTSASDLQTLFELVQQGVGTPATGFDACDYNNPVSCAGTSYPPDYANARLARNMFIRMSVNGNLSPIPVPAAVYLFGAGLVGLAGVARRRMAAKA